MDPEALKAYLIKKIDQNLTEYKILIAAAKTPKERNKLLALQNELMDTRAKTVAIET